MNKGTVPLRHSSLQPLSSVIIILKSDTFPLKQYVLLLVDGSDRERLTYALLCTWHQIFVNLFFLMRGTTQGPKSLILQTSLVLWHCWSCILVVRFLGWLHIEIMYFYLCGNKHLQLATTLFHGDLFFASHPWCDSFADSIEMREPWRKNYHNTRCLENGSSIWWWGWNLTVSDWFNWWFVPAPKSSRCDYFIVLWMILNEFRVPELSPCHLVPFHIFNCSLLFSVSWTWGILLVCIVHIS